MKFKISYISEIDITKEDVDRLLSFYFENKIYYNLSVYDYLIEQISIISEQELMSPTYLHIEDLDSKVHKLIENYENKSSK